MSMNDADRLISAWLESAAPTREPEHLLPAVLARTARTHRRPAWRIPERWFPMATLTTRAAAGGRPWAFAAIVALLALALVAGAVLLSGSRPTTLPKPFGPAANGMLVYELAGDLVSVDRIGGRTERFAAATALEGMPAFSNDGTHLAYLRAADPVAGQLESADLVVIDADGRNERQLGTFAQAGWPAWSPTGDRIALDTTVDGRVGIAIVDVASGQSRTLDAAFLAEQAAFRPGSDQLAFRGRDEGGTWGLYLVGVDGSNPTRLPLDEGFEDSLTYFQNSDYFFFNPVWSPDGTRLAFHTLEDSTVDRDPGFRVHVVDVDAAGATSNEIVLTPDAAIDDEFQATWLPNGSGIVAHRVEEGMHSLVSWPVSASPVTAGTPLVLGLAPFSPREDSDLVFTVAPDGMQVAAWEPGGSSWLVPVSGEPATASELVLDWGASWQRVAP